MSHLCVNHLNLSSREKRERNSSKTRLKELSNILLVNDNLIKQYEFKSVSDIIYFLLSLLLSRIGWQFSRIDIDLNDREFLREETGVAGNAVGEAGAHGQHDVAVVQSEVGGAVAVHAKIKSKKKL